MRDVVFWIGVMSLVWGPCFTVMYYSDGGEERKLSDELAILKENQNKLRRWWGMSLSLVFGKGTRWVISAFGLVTLIALKLAEAQRAV
jgi:hypothetical protein